MLSNIRLWCLTCPLIHIFGLIQKEMSVIQMRSENNSLDDGTKQNENNNNKQHEKQQQQRACIRTNTHTELIPLHCSIMWCDNWNESSPIWNQLNVYVWVCWAIHFSSSHCRYASLRYKCDRNCNLWLFSFAILLLIHCFPFCLQFFDSFSCFLSFTRWLFTKSFLDGSTFFILF